MKKSRLLREFATIFCLALVVSACGGQGATPQDTTTEEVAIEESKELPHKLFPTKNEQVEENATSEDVVSETVQSEAMEKTDMTEYKKVPYNLYPTSKDAWVGDVMPMTDGNVLQLYYLYDTDHNGSGYHPIHKFSTNNFYEYSDDGLVLNYGSEDEDPDRAIGTGCVLIGRDGKYHCFYTGHNDTAPDRGADKECVMHAVSDDNVNWVKIPEDTFYAEDNYSSDDFRDPFVFWNEKEQCYWLLIAAREKNLGGVVAKYTSTDLSNWKICEPLYAPRNQRFMLECPDLFKMGDHYYLFYSWDGMTYYAMSDSINGPFTEPENGPLDGTGFAFYAAKTAELNGKRYLCGWIGRKTKQNDSGEYEWAGNMVIHQLVQLKDGQLGVKAPDTLKDYFVAEKEIQVSGESGNVEKLDNGYRLSAAKKETSLINLGQKEPTMTLECNVVIEEEGLVGFGFGEGDKYDKYTGLVLDAKRNSIHYEGCTLARLAFVDPLITTGFTFEYGKEYKVKLVVENEIIILYIDDKKALSSRIYRSLDGANMVLFANGTACTFSDISIKVPEN